MTQPLTKEHISSPKKVPSAALVGVILTSPEPGLFTCPGFCTGIYVLRPMFPKTSAPCSWPCFAGVLPFSAGSLLVYMNLEKIWNRPRDRFSLLQNFANVCLAAAVTQTLSFPFDTVKRKMQVSSDVGGGDGKDALKCWQSSNNSKEH